MTPREQVLLAVREVQKRYPVRLMANWDSPRIRGRGLLLPEFVVLHHTAGYDSLAYLTVADHLYDSPGGEKVPGANFLIDRDGRVNVLSCFVTYHAGKGDGYGIPTDAMNWHSWGIEIEDIGLWQTMTEAQIDSASLLTAALLRARENSNLNYVINHKDWSSTGKQDTKYPITFWRTRVAKYITPQEEDDMDANTPIPIDKRIAERAKLPESPTVTDMFEVSARNRIVLDRVLTQLAIMTVAINALAKGEDVTTAIDAAMEKYFGGPIAADVNITVTPPQG